MPETRTLPWTASEILTKLENDQKWLERGILAIYARQTADEQVDGATKHENGRGFTGVDAEFLSGLAQWIERGRRPLGQRLTPRQVEIARKKMRKYAGQLAKVANERRVAEQAALAQRARDAFNDAVGAATLNRAALSELGCAPDAFVQCPTCFGMSFDEATGAACPTCRGEGRVSEMSLIGRNL